MGRRAGEQRARLGAAPAPHGRHGTARGTRCRLLGAPPVARPGRL